MERRAESCIQSDLPCCRDTRQPAKKWLTVGLVTLHTLHLPLVMTVHLKFIADGRQSQPALRRKDICPEGRLYLILFPSIPFFSRST